MASSKWQRRHYETVAAGLCAKGGPSAEIDAWISKFARDNPRFRADLFRDAAKCAGRRPRSRPRRPFKVPSLAAYCRRRRRRRR